MIAVEAHGNPPAHGRVELARMAPPLLGGVVEIERLVELPADSRQHVLFGVGGRRDRRGLGLQERRGRRRSQLAAEELLQRRQIDREGVLLAAPFADHPVVGRDPVREPREVSDQARARRCGSSAVRTRESRRRSDGGDRNSFRRDACAGRSPGLRARGAPRRAPRRRSRSVRRRRRADRGWRGSRSTCAGSGGTRLGLLFRREGFRHSP